MGGATGWVTVDNRSCSASGVTCLWPGVPDSTGAKDVAVRLGLSTVHAFVLVPR